MALEHFGLPTDLDDELWALFRSYMMLSFEPLTARQPWKFTRDYTTQVVEFAIQAKMVVAKSLMKRGIKDPGSPGTVFLFRLNYGVATLLAHLGAEADWPQLLVESGIDPA